MVEGCLEWQRDGLNPPAAVADATSTYLDAQDAISSWLEEKCVCGAHGWEARAKLYEDWTKWAASAGEHAGNRARFFDAMEARGFHAAKRSGERGFAGVVLKQIDYSEPNWNR